MPLRYNEPTGRVPGNVNFNNMINKELTNKKSTRNELINLVDTEYYIILELIKNVYGGGQYLYFIREKKTKEIVFTSIYRNDLFEYAKNEMKLNKICSILDYKELYQ